MRYDSVRISIKELENGFSVEVPDYEKMKKMKADAKKKSDAPTPTPYMGDCTKEYIAKDAKEVLKLVEGALKTMPEMEYDEAFAEASTAANK